MKIFSLTDLGKKVAKKGIQGDPDEDRIISHLKSYGSSSSEELEKVGELWVVRKLQSNGLVKELTQ